MSYEHLTPLADAQLGDLVALPDGTAHSVRARVNLSHPVRGMAGFVILDECQMLLSIPPVAGAPIGVLLPGSIPSGAVVTPIAEGATRYWAPHLPPVSGAMGELLWRVVGIAGIPDPAVVVFRGDEVIVYVRSAVALPQHLRVGRLDRSDDNDHAVARHSSTVIPAAAPATVPSELYKTFAPPKR